MLEFKIKNMMNCLSGLIVFLILQSQNMQSMDVKKSILISSDFNQERGDDIFVESVFKDDYAVLISDHKQHPYFEGKGNEIFKICAEKTKINDRKVFTVDDKPVSLAIYYLANKNRNIHLKNGDGVLAIMAVHKDFRRMGYGKMTVQYVIDWFKDKQCQQAWLEVSQNNESAQILYKKCGFLETDKSCGESCWMVLPLYSGYQGYLAYNLFSREKLNQLNNAYFKFQ